MRKTILAGLFASAAIAMTSCTKESIDEKPINDEIRLKTTVQSTQTRAIIGSHPNGKPLQPFDATFLRMDAPDNVTIPTVADPARKVVIGTIWGNGSVIWKGTQYYPKNGYRVAMAAFAPAANVDGNTAEFKVYGDTDIIATGEKVGSLMNQFEEYAFNFTHKLTMLQFSVQRNADFDDDTYIKSITIRDQRTLAKLQINTGVLTFEPAPIGDVSVHGIEEVLIQTTPTDTKGYAMIEAGTFPKSMLKYHYLVDVVTSKGSYTQVPIVLTTGLDQFTRTQAGVKYQITLTFANTGVSVRENSVVVTPWDGNGEGGGMVY